MATLKQNMDIFLEEEEGRKASFGGLPASPFPTLDVEPPSYEEELEFWEARKAISGSDGSPLDFVTHGLWNAADSLTFGALDWMDIDEIVWGTEYGYEEGQIHADNIWAKAGSAIGTVAGFIMPVVGPMALAGKAVSAGARGVAKLAGKPIMGTVIKETGERALYA